MKYCTANIIYIIILLLSNLFIISHIIYIRKEKPLERQITCCITRRPRDKSELIKCTGVFELLTY